MQIIETHCYSQGIAQRGLSSFPRPSKEVQLALPSFACPRAVGFQCLTYLQVDGQKRGCSKGASLGASIVTAPPTTTAAGATNSQQRRHAVSSTRGLSSAVSSPNLNLEGTGEGKRGVGRQRSG